MTRKVFYLAVDIGASSGRHILGWKENGKIFIEEIYRFENKLIKKNNHLCWDIVHLFNEVLEGLKICKKLDRIPKSIGIDTWGVDFVLLNKDGKVIGDTVAYRDSRTKGMDEIVYQIISEKELYERTRIQKQIFNSIYQFIAIKQNEPQILQQSEYFLMIPEYLNYLLTGVIKNEYTNATTSQLVNAQSKNWDFELIERLGIPKKIFGELNMPKSSVGALTEKISKEVGFQSEVVLPATHDTGSAVVAVPMISEDSIYLSSGTWSLMGIERMTLDENDKSFHLNFTNEGGYEYRYRYLKNIMGLWMMQSLRREFGHKYTFEELYQLAYMGRYFSSVVDVNAENFLAPESMITAIQNYCKSNNLEVPKTHCELLYCVYHSLAKYYAQTVTDIEEITNKKFSCINVVGGGSQDKFLNALIAIETGKNVLAGPVEATAIGNVVVQMLKDDLFVNIHQARQCIAESFDIHSVKTNLKYLFNSKEDL